MVDDIVRVCSHIGCSFGVLVLGRWPALSFDCGVVE
jgi:hypothetical protein